MVFLLFLFFFFFSFFLNLKASHLDTGTHGNYPGEETKGLAISSFSVLQVAGGFWWNVTKCPGLGGESEILRSLVVFFHGFAVTINLFLLNKKNRCSGVCWKWGCLL